MVVIILIITRLLGYLPDDYMINVEYSYNDGQYKYYIVDTESLYPVIMFETLADLRDCIFNHKEDMIDFLEKCKPKCLMKA